MGFVFIVLTNLLGVYSPQIISEGIKVLRQANSLYFEPLNEAAEGVGGMNMLSGEQKDAIVGNGELDLPYSLQVMAEMLGYDRDTSWSFSGYEDLLPTIVSLSLMLAILYAVVHALKGIFLFYQRQMLIVMSRNIEFDLKNEIFDQYQRLTPSFYKLNNTGDVMNRISEDVSRVRTYLGPAIMYTINLGVLIIMVVYVMFLIDWEMTLYSLTPLPLLSISIFYVSRKINAKSEEVQRQQSYLSTLVQEAVSGIRVLKAYNREKHNSEYFANQSNEYKRRSLALIKIDALLMPIIILLIGLSTILAIYVGALKVLSGELGIEYIFLFVFYVNMLTWPFASVGWVTSLVQQAEASQKRINEFLRAQPDIEDSGNRDTTIQGEIEFRNVTFIYPDSGTKALDGVSFRVQPGKTLAILGRTGSGKSTLAHLVNRLYEPLSGEILIDGAAISRYKLNSLRGQSGYVPQEVFLFSDTIGNNIAFGKIDATKEEIEAAAKIAGIHDTIIEYPLGYDTLLGERGINLSGGQKQRISIARAIIRHPSLLIFDDCLSAVDTQTEELILSNLQKIMAGRTNLIISHRVSSIRNADHILVLDRGRIAEEGMHEELLARRGIYYEMYRRQQLEERTKE